MASINIKIEKLGIDFSISVSDKLAKKILVQSLSESKEPRAYSSGLAQVQETKE